MSTLKRLLHWAHAVFTIVQEIDIRFIIRICNNLVLILEHSAFVTTGPAKLFSICVSLMKNPEGCIAEHYTLKAVSKSQPLKQNGERALTPAVHCQINPACWHRIFIDSREDVFRVTNKVEGVCKQRWGSENPVQIGVHPEVRCSAGSAIRGAGVFSRFRPRFRPGSDPVQARFRCSGCSAGCSACSTCPACSGVQHVSSVFRGVRSVQPVQPAWASGSGCSGDGSEGTVLTRW